jgi:hypothetical protein
MVLPSTSIVLIFYEHSYKSDMAYEVNTNGWHEVVSKYIVLEKASD